MIKPYNIDRESGTDRVYGEKGESEQGAFKAALSKIKGHFK